jgi:hypothetical protein
VLTYTVRLPGARTLDGRPTGRVLGHLLHALAHGAAGALRLRIEGRSSTRSDRLPAWVERGTEFTLLDFTRDVPGVVLRAPTLEEALPEQFEQADLFMPVDPKQSALSLMSASLAEATAGRVDSEVFDVDLLGVFTRDFARLFRRDQVRSLSLSNGSPDSPRLDLDATALHAVGRLRDRTPKAQRARLAGRMDEARYGARSFVLQLENGARVRGVRTDQGAETLKPYFGEPIVIEGMAQFRPSGRLLRVDVDRIYPATDRDVAVFSVEPRPLDQAIDPRLLRKPQGPSTGLNAIIGRWPGDESDEEFFRLVDELS